MDEELNNEQEDENEFFDLFDTLAAPFRGIEGAFHGVYNLADYVLADYLPDWDERWLGESQSTVGSLVESVSQFTAGFGPIFGIAGKAGALAKAGKLGSLAKSGSLTQRALSNNLTRGTGAAIASDFSVFNGQEARLSNLIQQYPELQNPITEFLAYEEGEGEIEGRLKNVLEGLGLEAATFGLIRGLKGIKKGNKIRSEGGGPLDVYKGMVDEMGGDLASVVRGGPEEIAEPGFSRRSGLFASRIDNKTKDFLIKGTQAVESGSFQTGGAVIDPSMPQAATIGRTLDQLANNADTPEVKELAKSLKTLVKDQDDLDVVVTYKPDAEGDPTKVRGGVEDKGSITGVYKPKDDRVELYGGADEQTLVHEMLHGVTAKKINAWVSQGGKDRSLILSNIDNVINNKSAPKPIRELARSFKLASEKVKELYGFEGKDVYDPEIGQGKYEFKDLDEFLVGAFTDINLQQILRRIPSDDKRSIFQKIVDAVYELFGVKGDKNLLNKVLRDSAQIISASRGSYMGKAKLVAEGRYYQKAAKFGKSLTSSALDKFRTKNKIPEIKLRKTGAHPTQIATTKATYEKVKPQLKEGSTIDFGAGKNIAVKAGIKADSFEPFPEKGFEPTFKDSSKIPSNSYDNVINNAVLNVVPQDVRDNLVSEIGRILKVGGKAFINVRGKDVFDSKHTLISKENMEVIVDSTGAYQKGFSKNELVGYLGEVLGDGFDVKVSNKFGTVAAEVTKRSDEGLASVRKPTEIDPTIKKAWQETEVDIETPRGRLPNIGQLNSTDKFDQVRIAGRDWVKANLPDPGSKSVDEITEEAFADIDNISPDLAKNFKATQINSLEKAKALRDEVAVMKMFGKSLAKKVLDQAQEYKSAKGSDVALAKLKNTFQELIEFEAYYSAIGREQSLGLGVRRFTDEYKPRKVGVDEGEIIASDGIRNKYLNESGGLDPDQFIKLVDEATDDGDLETTLTRMLKLAKKTQGNKFLNMTKEYWINAVLSGPRTHVVNMSGNFLTSFLSTLETAIGGALTGNMDVAKHAFASWADWEMVKESWKFSKNAWKKGENQLLPDSKAFDDGRIDSITPENMGLAQSDKLYKPMQSLGQFLRLPSRLLLTSDEWFKQMNYRRAARFKLAIEGLQGAGKIKDPYALAAFIEDGMQNVITTGGRYYSKEAFVKQATAQADAKGLTDGQERAAYITDYVSQNFDENISAIAEFAKDQTEYLTHTRDLEKGTFGYGVQQFTKNWPAASFVLPFVRTPTNLLSFSFERFLPVQGYRGGRALLSSKYRKEFLAEFKSPDPIIRAQALGKLTTGTVMTGMIVDMMWNNREYITGGGPKDENQKKALEATGWQPYSFKVGDKYISYQRLDPIGTVIGVVADMVETGVKHPKGFNQSPMEGVFAAIGITFSRNVTNKSYLSGVQMWTDALSEPERFVPRLLRNYASSGIPMSGFLGQSQYGVGDQEAREIRSIWEAMKNKTPGLRNSLDPKRNILGEAVTIENLPLIGALSPIATSSVKNDPVLTEMANLQHAFRNPHSTYNGVIDLLEFYNDKGQTAHDRRLEKLNSVRIGGRTMRQDLERLINSRRYQSMSPISEPGFESPRVEMINKVLRKYRSKALDETMQEFPELSKYYEQISKARYELSMGADHSDVLSVLTAQ